MVPPRDFGVMECRPDGTRDGRHLSRDEHMCYYIFTVLRRRRLPVVVDAVEVEANVGRVSVSHVSARTILTPASGFVRGYKFTLNPYGGCAFGCEYCYARFFVANAERRDKWGSWISAKRNAGELLAQACTSRKLRTGDAVYMSTVTDPYQPIERRLGLTRAVLETLLEHGVQPRLTIQTRSPLAARDIDLFRQFHRIRVSFTIGTDSDEVRRRYEPRCPSIDRRFSAAAEVAAAGVPVGVSVSPMLPIRDIEAFAQRLLALEADSYVTQYLKPAGRRFAAGSTVDAIRKAQEDGWGKGEYGLARETIARVLGDRHSLWEGSRGYGPA
jgi:DNA repair photolyase